MENTVNKDRSRLRSSLRRIAAAGLFGLCSLSAAFAQKQDYVQYVNTLQGTDSKFELSYGNTYATTGMPYGMHTWGAQTGPNGEGWKYQYSVDKIRGFQQAHQCSPWMSDYAVYSLMPEVGELVVNEDARASKFSHANEIAKPHYYRVTLDNGITTEMAPTTRGVHLRFTYPRKGDAYLVLDGYFAMSGMKIDPAKRQISGWVNNQRFVNHPETFRNYFVIQFDRPFEEYGLWENEHDERFPGMTEGEGKGYGAYVRFKAGTKVQARAASSYISPEQALLTLDRELGADKNLEATRKRGAGDVERPAGPHRSRRRHRRGDSAPSIRACSAPTSSRASSTNATPRAIPTITAPTTARYTPATCIPTTVSGIRSVRSSR